MRQIRHIKFLLILGMCVLGTLPIQAIGASQPNIVLNRALHFQATDGTPITLVPGKYFVEPAGSSELRLIRGRDKKGFIIQAQALTHEQYELFSSMALTRPTKDDHYFITLLLPGGQKLEAKGSTQAPPALPPTPVTETTPPPPITTPNPMEEMSHSKPAIVPPISIRQTTPPTEILDYHAPSPTIPIPQVGLEALPQQESPHILAVAPSHLGHTIYEQPTLYWYLSETTNQPIEVVLTEQGEIDIVFDMRLLPPLEAGMHRISLKDYGIRLLQDVPYQWEVTMIAERSKKKITTRGLIQRVSPSTTMPSAMNAESLMPESAQLYARSGLWYDAFWALSHLLSADPHNSVFLEQQTALLEQGGLTNLGSLPPIH